MGTHNYISGSLAHCSLMAIAAASAIAIGAAAAQAADCSGYDVLVTEVADTIEISGGGSLTLWKAHSINMNDDSMARDHLMAGACSGVIEAMADGSVKMSGYCTRTDKDGDTQSVRWWQDAGAEKGRWEHAGGTGKFANAAESGWFQGVMQSGVMSASRWSGDCS